MVAQIDSVYFKTSVDSSLIRLTSYLFFEGRPLTTRGRWFNPVVNMHLKLASRIGPRGLVKKPIFIVGMGRSGTTILGVLLSMHRQIAFLNEPKAIWHIVNPNEDVIGNYNNDIAKFRLSEADVTPKAIEFADRIYGYYLALTRRSRLVDKYPELVFRVPFVKKIFPDAKFIFLSRNGWDACSSVEGWSRRFRINVSNEIHDWWGRDQRKWKIMLHELIQNDPSLSGIYPTIAKLNDDRTKAIVEWIITMREGNRITQEFSESVFMVRYEDLVASPVEKLSEIFRFCELNTDNRCLTYAQEIIKPVPIRPKFKIEDILIPAFKNTMNSLGYI